MSTPTPSGYLEILTVSPTKTRSLGRRLGRLLRSGDVVLLEGPFGAGKTVLVQGIAAGLGVVDQVSSPSFTLVNEYRSGRALGSFPVYHADLYRIHGAREALHLGLEEYLSGRGVFIAEWPENAEDVWPDEALRIRLEVVGDRSRRLHITATGERYVRILEKIGTQTE